jgi:hypothetical protein
LVQWIVVAVVAVLPAPALEPVSLHFRQPWQVLPVDYPNQKDKRHRNIIQEWLTVCSLFDTAIQLLLAWRIRARTVAFYFLCARTNTGTRLSRVRRKRDARLSWRCQPGARCLRACCAADSIASGVNSSRDSTRQRRQRQRVGLGWVLAVGTGDHDHSRCDGRPQAVRRVLHGHGVGRVNTQPARRGEIHVRRRLTRGHLLTRDGDSEAVRDSRSLERRILSLRDGRETLRLFSGEILIC